MFSSSTKHWSYDEPYINLCLSILYWLSGIVMSALEYHLCITEVNLYYCILISNSVCNITRCSIVSVLKM